MEPTPALARRHQVEASHLKRASFKVFPKHSTLKEGQVNPSSGCFYLRQISNVKRGRKYKQSSMKETTKLGQKHGLKARNKSIPCCSSLNDVKRGLIPLENLGLNSALTIVN